MKRLLMAVAALGLATGAARADWGGPGAPPSPNGSAKMQLPQIAGPNTLLGAGDPYNGAAPDKYGLHPRLRKLFRIGARTENPVPPSYYWPMAGYGQSGPAYNPTGYPPGAYPSMGAYGPAQGTLVFPHHPFLRSPRDYFMTEPNR